MNTKHILIIILVAIIGTHSTLQVIKTDAMEAFSLIHNNEGYEKLLLITPTYNCPICQATVKTIYDYIHSLSTYKKIQLFWVEGRDITDNILIKVYKSNGDQHGKLYEDISLSAHTIRSFITKYITNQQNGKIIKASTNGYSVKILDNGEQFLEAYDKKIKERQRYLKIKGQLTEQNTKEVKINPTKVQMEIEQPKTLHQQSINKNPSESSNSKKHKKKSDKKLTHNQNTSLLMTYLLIFGGIFLVAVTAITIKQNYRKKDNFMVVMSEEASNLV